MSKGSKRVTFRIPKDIAEKVQGEIISHNYYSKGQPWNLTDFILKAIEEKIAHATRSRRKGKKSLQQDDDVILNATAYTHGMVLAMGVRHPEAVTATEKGSEDASSLH